MFAPHHLTAAALTPQRRAPGTGRDARRRKGYGSPEPYPHGSPGHSPEAGPVVR